MADWKNLGDRAKNLTLVGLGKARDLGESAKLNLDNVSEEENRKRKHLLRGELLSIRSPKYRLKSRSRASGVLRLQNAER